MNIDFFFEKNVRAHCLYAIIFTSNYMFAPSMVSCEESDGGKKLIAIEYTIYIFKLQTFIIVKLKLSVMPCVTMYKNNIYIRMGIYLIFYQV